MPLLSFFFNWRRFFFHLFYLFIFGCTGSPLMHGLFSSCGERGYSLVLCRLPIVVASLAAEGGLWGLWAPVAVARGLCSCSSLASSTGSVVMALRLTHSRACGIFPDQGLNPCLLHWQVDSFPLSHQESPSFILLRNNTVHFFLMEKYNVFNIFMIIKVIHAFYSLKNI